MAVAIQHIMHSMNVNGVPTIVAVGNIDSGNAAVTPGLPLGHTTNDILLCFVQSSNETISVPTNATSGTWAEITNSPQSGSVAATVAGAVRLGVFWMRDPGTTIGTVTVADSGNHTIAGILAYRGCITSGNPWDVTAGTSGGAIANSAWATLPNITTTTTNTLILAAVAHSKDSATSPLSAFDWTATNVVNAGSNNTQINSSITTGTGGGLAINEQTSGMAAAGALSTGANGSSSSIPDPAWAVTGAGACNWVAITIALRST